MEYCGVISGIVNTIKNTISNVLNAISSIWSSIWNAISNVVKNIWNGIWGCIKGVINAILGGIEGFVNGVIKGINFVLKGISSVANAVGSLIGLSPINLQIGLISLPRLAKGGVLTEATAVIAGEYSGASTNPEIVTPQNIMYDTMRKALSDSSFNDNNINRPIRVQVSVGGKNLVDELIDGINEKTRQTGKAQIKVSYA